MRTHARDQVEEAERLYTSAGKCTVRAVVVGVAREVRPLTVLDLWGTGESARAFREALPDSTVVSCERDPVLQPLLVGDAQKHGYAYHLGDVAEAPGRYDMVWLDFCAQASASVESTIRAVARKVNPGGLLFITLMPARETERLLSGPSRLRHVPMWVEEAASMRVGLFVPYRRDNGQPMWLLGLRASETKSHFSNDVQFEMVRETMVEEGWWRDAWPRTGFPMRVIDVVMLDAILDPGLPPVASASEAFERAKRAKRVVKMSDLTEPQRRLVSALVAMGRKSRERHLDEWGVQ